jgi:hypothetical protein
MTSLLVEDDVDALHVKMELDMTLIVCIKKLEVSGMTWLLVEHDMNVLHVEIELKMTWKACIKKLEVSSMISSCSWIINLKQSI